MITVRKKLIKIYGYPYFDISLYSNVWPAFEARYIPRPTEEKIRIVVIEYNISVTICDFFASAGCIFLKEKRFFFKT
jgi:hypothetical protein